MVVLVEGSEDVASHHHTAAGLCLYWRLVSSPCLPPVTGSGLMENKPILPLTGAVSSILTPERFLRQG